MSGEKKTVFLIYIKVARCKFVNVHLQNCCRNSVQGERITGSFLLSFHADTLKIQQETRPGSIKADDKTVIRISHTLQGIFF